jgi:phytoene dehydrogenase-like protein
MKPITTTPSEEGGGGADEGLPVVVVVEAEEDGGGRMSTRTGDGEGFRASINRIYSTVSSSFCQVFYFQL